MSQYTFTIIIYRVSFPSYGTGTFLKFQLGIMNGTNNNTYMFITYKTYNFLLLFEWDKYNYEISDGDPFFIIFWS